MIRRAVIAALPLLVLAHAAPARGDDVPISADRSVVMVDGNGAQRSGFALGRAGTVYTSSDVGGPGAQVDVVDAEGAASTARVAANQGSVALLSADAAIPPLAEAAARPQQGDEAIVIGATGTNGTLGSGEVTSTGASIGTDLAVRDGNLGGPLLDARGAVIGIVTGSKDGAVALPIADAIAAVSPSEAPAATAQPATTDDGGGFPAWLLLPFLFLAVAAAVALALRRRPAPSLPPVTPPRQTVDDDDPLVIVRRRRRTEPVAPQPRTDRTEDPWT